MKITLLSIFARLRAFFIITGMLFSCVASAQQNWNIPLLSNWDDNTIPPAWTGAYSTCWGYAANGREYAILASTQGSYFFDITDPSSPQLVDYFRTKDTLTLVVNKDYANYTHYLYAGSDQGDNALQIFDLQYLPDSVVLAYDSNALSKRCHTISVEGNRLYLCANTRPDGSFGPMDILSLDDPLNPILLNTITGNYIHEVFVQHDTAYCSRGYHGMDIFDLRNVLSPVLISTIEFYQESGYNHSSWLSADSKIMALTDEDHGRGVKIFNMSDITEPVVISVVRSNMLQIADSLTSAGSVAHIPYLIGNTMLVSYYHDGVVAYDISNPASPVCIGYYDTYPQNTDYYSYNGCWAVYPFLPSGNIIASDITNGLFVFDGSKILNIQHEIPLPPSLTIGINPVRDQLSLLYTSIVSDRASVTIFDMAGKLILEKEFILSPDQSQINIPLQSFASGMYVAKVKAGEKQLVEKFLKANW